MKNARTSGKRTRRQLAMEDLIVRVAGILDAGEPTRFAYESSAIAGLRAGWCLRSWPWRDADAQARAVVSEALHKLGVSRPTWLQGQREYAERVGGGFTFCATCGGVLEQGQKKYCSPDCHRAARVRRQRRDDASLASAEYGARLAAKKAGISARKTRTCVVCGSSFELRANKQAQDHCSTRCFSAARRRPPKPCAHCGELFWKRNVATAYCSTECAKAARRREQTCEHCGSTFTTTHAKVARFCGVRCGQAARERARRAP